MVKYFDTLPIGATFCRNGADGELWRKISPAAAELLKYDNELLIASDTYKSCLFRGNTIPLGTVALFGHCVVVREKDEPISKRIAS